MKLLIDTHVFLWLNSAPEKLSNTVRNLCEQGTDRFYLSLVTPWEMQIKRQLGKLIDTPVTDSIVRTNLEQNNIDLLPITLAHIEELAALPHHHRDPFDRMLIAQARSEGMTLVSADQSFAAYEVPVLW